MFNYKQEKWVQCNTNSELQKKNQVFSLILLYNLMQKQMN